MDSNTHTQQTVLSDHFNAHDEDVIPYSNRAFEAAAIEMAHRQQSGVAFLFFHQANDSNSWTLQPIHAFKNPKFKAMLDMASRATKGIAVPTPRKTHGCVILSFKQKMYLLWDCLKVSVSIVFLCFFTLTSILLGPHCSWGNQFDLRHMAGRQY